MKTICNYLQLGDQLHTAGQPTENQLKSLGRYGIRTVINLALPTSDNAVAEEAALVTGQGIRYFHIPVIWEKPEREDFSLFMALLPLVEHEPLLVHCALNMRVSAFIYLYRRIKLGIDDIEVVHDLRKIWIPHDQWYLFINRQLQDAGLAETDFQ